jgi:hypothetical protein
MWLWNSDTGEWPAAYSQRHVNAQPNFSRTLISVAFNFNIWILEIVGKFQILFSDNDAYKGN